jgi:environmental stress-induced protein Ves
MRIIRSSQIIPMRWKNGGGETTEIAISPEGADLDNFDWRVSMARIERNGPFSTFPGIDRTLAILTGAGLCLTIADRQPLTLTRATEPVSFSGDLPTFADLLGGPVSDLNVMVRRSRFSHRVTRMALETPISLAERGTDTFLLCADGNAQLDGPLGSAVLGPGDVWHGRVPEVVRWLSGNSAAVVYLIEIL